MNTEEPSVLDWFKSLIDPRRERIRIPPPDERAGAHSSAAAYKPGDPEASEVRPAAHLGPAGAGAMADQVRPQQQPPSDLPTAAAPASSAPAQPLPVVKPEVFPGLHRLPWSALLAMVFGFGAQLAFEPPDRSLNRGLLLYAIAGLFLGWSIWRQQWRLPQLRPVQQVPEPMTVRRLGWALGIPLAMLAYLLFSGNRFTPFNTFIWALALIYLLYAFWQTGSPGSPSGQGSQRLWSLRQWRPVITPWMMVLLAAAAVVLFFRYSALEQVPPQMFSDHAEKLQDVQDVLNGETRIFFPRNTGREAFQMYLTAAFARYAGTGLSFLSLKLGTATMGVFALIFIYLLGKELAGRRVALFATLLAGVAYWPNVISRVALRFTLYPALLAPTMYFLVRGLRRGSRNDFILAGIFLGIGLHGYSPFRFVPFLVLAAMVIYLVHRLKGGEFDRLVWHLALLVAFSFVIILPLMRYALESEENRINLTHRTLTRMSDAERPLPGPASQIFVQNTWRALTMFAWDNGETWVHSVTHRPALDVVSACLFFFGVILLLYRYLRERNWEDIFLLISIPLLMMPSILSLAFPSENPSLNRTAGAIIPVFLIIGLALDGLLTRFEESMGRYWGPRIGWSAVSLLLVWSAFNNYDLVFNQYYQQFRASSWNTTELGQVIRGFADSIGTEDSAWVVPWPHWVDTRLVGINAGVPIRDYALPRERLTETRQVPGPKLFLLNTQDAETLEELRSIYPLGSLSTFESEVEGKDFWVYLAPAVSQIPVETIPAEQAPGSEGYPYPGP